MLRVLDVAKSYGDARILTHITFTLSAGARAGLIGPNGAGKSTLLRIIAGLETPDQGSVWLDPAARVGYHAQALPHTPEDTAGSILRRALGPALTALDTIAQLGAELATATTANQDTALTRYGAALEDAERLDAYGTQARLAEVLAGLGLDGLDLDTPVAVLSGGQKARLSLGCLLLAQPALLLLDEPTNYLDLGALAWLQEFVAQYPGAVLLVSHDRAFLDTVATTILALDPVTHTLKEYPGTYTGYEDTLARQQERQRDDYRRQQERITQVEANVRGIKQRAATHPHSPQAKKAARTAKVRERKLERYLASAEYVEKPRQSWQLKLDFGPALTSGQQVLALSGVGKAFGDQPLFAGVTAELRQGERVALLGPNGAGKTTLLRIISGRLAPDSGVIRLGANVRPGYFAQEQEGLDPTRTVLEAVRDVVPLAETEARHFLHFFLFAGNAVFTPVGQLSYGERARLVLARLVLSGANFLLLDEPLNHLDIPSRRHFEEALAAFPGTVLAVAHDRYFVGHFANRIWALGAGRLTTFFDLEEYEQAMYGAVIGQ